MKHFIAALLLFASPLAADRLPETAIEYLGSFSPPPILRSHVGGTLVPCDVGGGIDPTPADGYPGCMAAYGSASIASAKCEPHLLYVYDLVPAGGKAALVSGPHDIQAGKQNEVLGCIGSSQAYDLAYDETGSECRIWWTWGAWYSTIENDPPFLGVSSCDLNDPQPRGLWELGPEFGGHIDDDPFHTAKGYRRLQKLPASIADRFDGHEIAVSTSGVWGGSRGSSQGPSFYTIPDAIPTQEQILAARDRLWYYAVQDYMRPYKEPELSGPAARYWSTAVSGGSEAVSTEAGDALLVTWLEPMIPPDGVWPRVPGNPYTGVAKYPQPGEVPHCYYGVATCRAGVSEYQQPSWWEWDRTGARMPKDCEMGHAGHEESTGPHCHPDYYRRSILLYDLTELSACQSGRNCAQPYAAVKIEADVHHSRGGTAYDSARQLLYILASEDNGLTPRTYVFKVGSGSQPPPEPTCEEQGLCEGPNGECIACPVPIKLEVSTGLVLRATADPGEIVTFLGAVKIGSHKVDGCTTGLHRPWNVATVEAGADGIAKTGAYAHGAAYYQAIGADCDASEVLEYTP